MKTRPKRIIVKIGTNSMMQNGKIDKALIKNLAQELSSLRVLGSDVVLVSSGAIGFGIEKMKRNFPKGMSMKQAMASIGQNLLMNEYERNFKKFDQTIAQILVTPQSFVEDLQLKNLQSTVESLFSLDVIPIMNENDVVAIDALSEEKVFSDNDGLAALAAINFEADLLVILTDVDGVFTDNPKENHLAEKICNLEDLLNKSINGSNKSTYGIGGIKSKILAVNKVLEKGVSVAVCQARKGAIADVVNGKCTGSFFEKDAYS